MVSEQGSENSQPIMIALEIVPEDEQYANPAMIGEIGRSVINALKKDGYGVEPVYTGQRGGVLFIIPMFVELAVQAIAVNKDLLIELFKVAEPVLGFLFRERDKQASNGQNMKVTVEIDGESISVEAPDVGSVERLMKLANRFWVEHPKVAANVTPQSKVRVKGSVSSSQQRRRR